MLQPCLQDESLTSVFPQWVRYDDIELYQLLLRQPLHLLQVMTQLLKKIFFQQVISLSHFSLEPSVAFISSPSNGNDLQHSSLTLQ